MLAIRLARFRHSRSRSTSTVASSWRTAASRVVAGSSVAMCGAGMLLLSTDLGIRRDLLKEDGRGYEAPASLLSAGDGEYTPRRLDLCRRAFWLLWSFSLVLLLSPWALLSKDFCEAAYYRLVYEAICYSRSAALAKWSQWASVRLDLFPATLCNLLAQLQASAPTHSFAHTLLELHRAGLLAPPGEERSEKHIHSIEGLPLASGSIAQVHLAKCGQEAVVVKVRHPRVNEELVLDFQIMLSAANTIHTWVPLLRWMNAPATVSQFEAAMSGQCDLSQEAVHLSRFRKNFKRKQAWAVFPRPISASPAVLVETLESGVLMSEFVTSWRGREIPASELADAHFVIARGEDVYLQMLLVDNFMHADLHPGNMLFRKVGPSGKPQIVILDAGMAADLTTAERSLVENQLLRGK
ncbi:unnamed protein product, partial [Polarella glacialis]